MPAIEMEGGQPKPYPATGQPSPMLVFFPRSAATILDTWHTVGMRGTGSADIAVKDLFVPDRLTFLVSRRTGAGFEKPPGSGQDLFLGDDGIDRHRRQCDRTSGSSVQDQDTGLQRCSSARSATHPLPAGQGAGARDGIAGHPAAAMAVAYDELERTGAVVHRGQGPDSRWPNASPEACAEAVRFVDDVVGTSSVRLGAPFERHFRDVHVLMQHATKSHGVYGTAGRTLLGLEPDRFWFIF
jgi:hypothetical protein